MPRQQHPQECFCGDRVGLRQWPLSTHSGHDRNRPIADISAPVHVYGMPEWKFHPIVAWALGLASGFIAFMTLAMPVLFGMLYGALHPDEDGKIEGSLLPI